MENKVREVGVREGGRESEEGGQVGGWDSCPGQSQQGLGRNEGGGWGVIGQILNEFESTTESIC